MSQDETHNAAGAGEQQSAPPEAPHTPPRPANPEPHSAAELRAPDAYAVGVRVLRMAPAWLLTITVSFVLLILLLGWMRAGSGDAAVALAHNPARNDARAPKARPSSPAAAPSSPAPQATPAATQPAPAAAPAAAAPEPPKAPEKTQPTQPSPAADAASAGAKFTVQVGSYSSPSEANERVSALRAAGFESRAVAVEIQGRGTWYRVQVGRFAERAEASKAVEQLRARGAATGAIITPLQN